MGMCVGVDVCRWDVYRWDVCVYGMWDTNRTCSAMYSNSTIALHHLVTLASLAFLCSIPRSLGDGAHIQGLLYAAYNIN